MANHAYISAIFGAYLCKEALSSNVSYFPLLVFSSILYHHGDLQKINNKRYLMPLNSKVSYSSEFESIYGTLMQQLANISDNIDYILSDYRKINLDTYVHSFIRNEKAIAETLIYLKKQAITFEDDPDDMAFWIHQNFYSCLIAADKISAARITPVEVLTAPLDVLMQHKEVITGKNSSINLQKCVMKFLMKCS